MTQDETEVQPRFAYHGKQGGSVLKSKQCWEGANGNLMSSQAEAAADIIGDAKFSQVMNVIRDNNNHPSLAEAILWVASKINKQTPNKQTPKRKKNTA